MYLKLIYNDIKRSRTLTATVVIFVASAAMLVTLAASLIVSLSSAMDSLMSAAETPHFMQMHSGEIDSERLSAFAGGNSLVEEYQLLEFLNIDGADFIIDGASQTGSIIDNGLSTQSPDFDYLLDLDGRVIAPSAGEIYLPVSCLKESRAKIGGKAVICGREFTVAGFLRDSQMNSSLASSKRFLISEADYSALRSFGSVEYLIEFRLKDQAALADFENDYSAAGLEANGPTVTYPLFRLLNALSDGIMIALILLVCILTVAIALMCIRFSLLARIEEDYREIGIMKAIGLRISDIKKIYLSKYILITAAGSLLGFALSFAFNGMLMENIRLYMGGTGNAFSGLLIGLAGIAAVFVLIILYVASVLRRFRKIPAAGALRFGIAAETAGSGRHFTLERLRFLNTNIFLGLKDVLSRKKMYLTMLAVLVAASFIIIVPQNLYSTISSRSFTSYMGVGICDLRIDIQQTDEMDTKTSAVIDRIKNDADIARYSVLTTKTLSLLPEDGRKKNIKVELGDHSVFPVEYSEGRAPAGEDEIALSSMNAEKLGKKIGDAMEIITPEGGRRLRVCGIYSDITNGGKTAKAAFSSGSGEIMWSIISVELSERSDAAGKAAEYAAAFPYAKVSDIDEFIAQTFGPTKSSVAKAAAAAAVAALTVAALVTIMFMKMLMAKDRYSIAVLKASGFTVSDIKLQYVVQSAFILAAGLIIGTILAGTAGELLAGLFISSLGASTFDFTTNIFFTFLLSPLMLALAVITATLAGISDTGTVKIPENIKE